MALIEREKLYGLGCGLVDLLLLASALITPERLAGLAARFGVQYQAVSH
jgi:hypothetical protein